MPSIVGGTHLKGSRLFISKEVITNTGSTITPLDKVFNYKMLFLHIITIIVCGFSPLSHVAAETYYPLPYCASICSLISVTNV